MSDTFEGMVALADLPFDLDAAFYACEEETDAVAFPRFGTTSRHVLATWLPAAFRKWGARYKLVEGWEGRGRPMSSGYFDPNGLLVHHTGSKSSATNPAPSLNTVIQGRSDLTGPLCQISTDYNGLTYIVAAGRANHAGKARAIMGNPAGDGNAMYLGNEVQTSGLQKMPAAQLNAIILTSAAIMDHFGYTGASKTGLHHTTSLSGKWDLGEGTGAYEPYSLSSLRAAIAARLKAGPPGAAPAPAPAPAPVINPLTGEPQMYFYRVENADRAIGNAVIATDLLRARWVAKGAHWDAIKAQHKAQTGRDLVETVVPTLEGLALEFVGPLPVTNYPIPQGMKVVTA